MSSIRKTACFFAAAMFAGVMVVATPVLAADTDGDGITDDADNCAGITDFAERCRISVLRVWAEQF